MTLFIASEVMFFVAWFWAYFNASLFPTDVIGATWPPPDVKTFDPWDIPLINTLILLLSGTTVTWAHHAMLEDDRKGLVNGLILTVFLGFIFTCFQAYEYHHATFTIDGNIYGSTFYMATGFHGFHVIVGTIFLAVCLFRSMKGHSNSKHHFGFEAAAWYWHFVDVVWLFYLLRSIFGEVNLKLKKAFLFQFLYFFCNDFLCIRYLATLQTTMELRFIREISFGLNSSPTEYSNLIKKLSTSKIYR